MTDTTLLRHLQDACLRSSKHQTVIATAFLSPAEQAMLTADRDIPESAYRLYGGDAQCERRLALFLPDYMQELEIPYEEYIAALHITTHNPSLSHRDILGSVLAAGIERDTVGDIRIFDGEAYVFMLPVSADAVRFSLEKIGRYHASVEEIDIASVPQSVIQTKEITFTVQTVRLDAVAAGMFHISRTEAAEKIRMGLTSVNYLPCEKPDSRIDAGDVISIRGHGKAVLREIGGNSRKGRIFLKADLYV